MRSERIVWIDNAKAMGIFLVYYGHYISVYRFSDPWCKFQLNFIYSFHMPLFFFLSGCVYKYRDVKVKDYLNRKFTGRFRPLIFFNFLCFLWVVFYDIINGLFSPKTVKGYIVAWNKILFKYGMVYNFSVSWFLVCLFITEMIFFIFNKFVKNSGKALLLSLLFFSTAGFLAAKYSLNIKNLTGIPQNFWHIYQSLTTVVFYIMGYLFIRFIPLIYLKNKYLNIMVLSVSFVALCYTSQRNVLVGVVVSQYGNIAMFYFNSIMGILMVLALCQLVTSRTVLFIGENTLILLGLDGIFQKSQINMLFHGFIKPLFNDNILLATLLNVIITVLCIVACVPVIKLIRNAAVRWADAKILG